MKTDPDTHSTRSSLIARVSRSPDDPGWAEFDTLYRGFLVQVCRQMGLSEEDAKDISQEVLAGLVKKLPEFRYDRDRGCFRGWLRQRVRWKVWDRSKRPSERIAANCTNPAEGMEAMAMGQSSGEFDEVWDREWEAHLLQTAKERVKLRVNIRSFQVYDLVAAKERSVKEVAGLFAITENNVYKIRHDVEAILMDELAQLAADLG
jgi:RNA polymerase sigma factor (sigma-70 family)